MYIEDNHQAGSGARCMPNKKQDEEKEATTNSKIASPKLEQKMESFNWKNGSTNGKDDDHLSTGRD